MTGFEGEQRALDHVRGALQPIHLAYRSLEFESCGAVFRIFKHPLNRNSKLVRVELLARNNQPCATGRNPRRHSRLIVAEWQGHQRDTFIQRLQNRVETRMCDYNCGSLQDLKLRRKPHYNGITLQGTKPFRIESTAERNNQLHIKSG